MNYRHAFHAGNFADVLKHATLARAVTRLAAKPKPFRIVDTHAGIAWYRLDGPEAARTGEWQLGIGRLIEAAAPPLDPRVAEILAPYLDVVRKANPEGPLRLYPGSPALALALMRPDDRLVANELHPEDAAALEAALSVDRRVKVMAMDGWQAIRALLPPKERRGLVLIDPPFEAPGEMGRLESGLDDGLARFRTGVYILWLPIKDRAAATRLEAAIAARIPGKVLWAELRIASPLAAEGLAATALAIVNPPFGLEADLALLLPFLAERLARDEDAGWRLASH